MSSSFERLIAARRLSNSEIRRERVVASFPIRRACLGSRRSDRRSGIVFAGNVPHKESTLRFVKAIHICMRRARA